MDFVCFPRMVVLIDNKNFIVKKGLLEMLAGLVAPSTSKKYLFAYVCQTCSATNMKEIEDLLTSQRYTGCPEISVQHFKGRCYG